jgi:hypothetical protein
VDSKKGKKNKIFQLKNLAKVPKTGARTGLETSKNN